jgi:biopolymer transport protein ExbD
MARRNRYEDHSEGVQLDRMITPMLDMFFQIFFFFIIFYNPVLETQFAGKLLPPENVAKAGKPKPMEPKEKDIPIDLEPTTKDVIKVIVKAVEKGKTEGGREEGEPSRILLKRPEVPEPELVADSTSTLEAGLKKLGAELGELKKRAGDTKLQLNLEADGHLRYQYFILVQNVCKEAKFENVGFPRPPQEK